MKKHSKDFYSSNNMKSREKLLTPSRENLWGYYIYDKIYNQKSFESYCKEIKEKITIFAPSS